jgi:Zn-dependent protease
MIECFLIVVILWIFSVCLHEFGHAWVAYHGGDVTVKDKGYLDLNPLRSAHPFLSLALPLLFLMMGGIGLPGGAVYINHALLKSRRWETLVSLAGPFMNFLVIVLISVLFRSGILPNDPSHTGSIAFAFLCYLQITALLFNLLPFPPLDGFQALAPLFSRETSARIHEYSGLSLMVLFLLFSGTSPLAKWFDQVTAVILEAAGVDWKLVVSGYEEFRVWKHWFD